MGSRASPIDDDGSIESYTSQLYRRLKQKRVADNNSLWGAQVSELKRSSVNNEDDISESTLKRKFICPQKDSVRIKDGPIASFEISSDIMSKVERHNIIEMPPVQPVPRMVYWIEVDSNIRIKEPVKFNVGNESDDFDSDEDPAVKEFIASSTTNSHPDSNGTSSTFTDNLEDDQLFISLVNDLLKHERGGRENDDIELSGLSSLDLKKSSVFNVIHRLFPKAPFPFILRERYLTLMRARRSVDAEKTNTPSRALSLSRDEILEPFYKLFCRRCYTYNCLLHGDDEKVPPENCLSYPVYTKRKKRPCSLTCYRYDTKDDLEKATTFKSHLSTTSSQDDSCFLSMPSDDDSDFKEKREKVSSKSKDETFSGGDTWTFEEIVLLKSLYHIYPNCWCKLASIISTKNCSQVCRFAKLQQLPQQQMKQKIPEFEEDPKRIKSIKDLSQVSKSRTITAWFRHSKNNDLLLARPPSKRPRRFPLYKPCNHKGQSCSEAVDCTCLQNRINCEKFCCCVSEKGNCSNLFIGCRCKGTNGGCDSKRCSCFTSNRECDVDICGCGISNPETTPCNNHYIQDYMKKKIYRDLSEVSGYGLFAGEDIDKDEFIGEYVGEIITTEESDRRGVNQDSNDHIYLFTKDEEQVIDGKIFGNLLRFINSSPKPNIYPLIKNVRGNLRIGLYAQRDISEGEEMFFNYEKVLKQQFKNNNADESRKTPMATKDQGSSPSESVISNTLEPVVFNPLESVVSNPPLVKQTAWKCATPDPSVEDAKLVKRATLEFQRTKQTARKDATPYPPLLEPVKLPEKLVKKAPGKFCKTNLESRQTAKTIILSCGSDKIYLPMYNSSDSD